MMTVGDAIEWQRHFVSVDQRLLARIVVVWPGCLAVLPAQPTEDQITINLVDLLAKDQVVRRICHWIEYQFEPFGVRANGAKYSKGKIDVGVLMDWERERYLAYECKRLNVIYNGNRSSLATEYVKEGMMRFMTEQYAEALPVGCMLGYVLDGDIIFAMKQLDAAIKAHGPLGLAEGPNASTSLANATRFITMHNRPTKTTIELRHALLPFPVGQHRQTSALAPQLESGS
jgi:hypothetical protein